MRNVTVWSRLIRSTPFYIPYSLGKKTWNRFGNSIQSFVKHDHELRCWIAFIIIWIVCLITIWMILSKLVEEGMHQEFDWNLLKKHYVKSKIKDQCYRQGYPEQISIGLPRLERNLIKSLLAALLESLVAELLQLSERFELLCN